MAINLQNVSFKQIKPHNKKIGAEFKEFYALLDFQSFIFENDQMRLKNFDYSMNTPPYPAPRLQKTDFDFLIENQANKIVFAFVDTFKTQQKAFEQTIKSALCAKDLNVTQIEFQNEFEIAYFSFLLQLIAFCDYTITRKINEKENSKIPNLNNFIFEFICRAFVFQKCPVLNSIEFEKALAFERGNMYRVLLQRQEETFVLKEILGIPPK